MSQALLDALQTMIPIRGAFAIVPSDVADLPKPVRQISIGTLGTVKVQFAGGDIVTYKKLDDSVISGSIVKVFATGTTATNMVGEV